MSTSFYVPMFLMALWNLYAMIKALQWASLPEAQFKADNRSRQIVLFNSFVSILFALGIFTYANNQLSVKVKMPKFALGSMITWQLLSNLIVASYAWKRLDGKPIAYKDWRRNFTRLASLVNLIMVLMAVFGVQFINLDKLKKPLA